ncbi:ATP synthase F0 subunit A [Pseudonocardiaceae bacterium YIM PH 21723]|nr:ATP synthase F0 subunit A [Pseudonocardiaceae bacterium YIM PH 21723]
MGMLVLAEGGEDKFQAPSVSSFDFPEIFAGTGITKPMVQIVLSAIIVAVFWLVASRNLRIVPGKFQFAAEEAYTFLRNDIARSQIGNKDFRPYVPLVVSLFTFVLVNNLFGFIPFFQLPTFSHFGFPIGLTIMLYLLYNFVGIRRHGLFGYLKNQTAPPGVPWPIYFLLVPIEFFSKFIMQPITHAIRVFAAMFAGHMILLVFVGAGEFLLLHGDGAVAIVGPFSLIVAVAMSFLELLIQVLQAYVFALLAANYIGAALAEDH